MTAVGVEVTRLLAGLQPDRRLDLGEHVEAYGPVGRAAGGPGLIEVLERSGLRGRGGGSFPTGRKLRAVATGRRRPLAVVNGCESEPASAKDRLLLERLPHLVLDGALLAASAVGADEAVICVSEDAPRTADALDAALRERRERTRLTPATVPAHYVASEESALIHHLNGGAALPTFVPPRPFERGLRGRPTLVQNAETLAHVALIARHGAEWFRAVGTRDDPGSTLLTVSGHVRWPGVYEVALGTPLAELVALARPTRPVRALLLGGCFGTWVAHEDAAGMPLAHHGLRERAASLGAGVVVVLGQGTCGLCETAAALEYLADESAGQCGPCVFGLRAIADRMAELADGTAPPGSLEQLARWAAMVARRGACHHPDGAVRLLRSALDVFAAEAAAHQAGGACPSMLRGAALGLPVHHRRGA